MMPSPQEPLVGVLRLGQPIITQQELVIDLLMDQCWYSFYDAGTALTHQWVNVSCFLGTQLPVP